MIIIKKKKVELKTGKFYAQDTGLKVFCYLLLCKQDFYLFVYFLTIFLTEIRMDMNHFIWFCACLVAIKFIWMIIIKVYVIITENNNESQKL